jgi:hypothetical protein
MITEINIKSSKKKTPVPPDIDKGENPNWEKDPYKGKLTIIYKNSSKETYNEASIVRKSKSNKNNTLWVLFFGRIICLKQVRCYAINDGTLYTS